MASGTMNGPAYVRELAAGDHVRVEFRKLYSADVYTVSGKLEPLPFVKGEGLQIHGADVVVRDTDGRPARNVSAIYTHIRAPKPPTERVQQALHDAKVRDPLVRLLVAYSKTLEQSVAALQTAVDEVERLQQEKR